MAESAEKWADPTEKLVANSVDLRAAPMADRWVDERAAPLVVQ
jgi:hypothetical protein